MKLWTTLCVFCLAYQTAVGQLKGTYTINYGGFDIQTIRFYKKNKFQYTHFGCIRREKGKGTYTRQDSTLVLTFEEATKNPHFRTTATPIKNQTSKLRITFSDSDTKEAFLGAMIALRDKNRQIYKEQTLGLEGFVEMELPASSDTFQLEFSMIGIGTFSYPIIPQQDYQIEAVYSFSKPNTVEAGKQMIFYIEFDKKGNPKALFEKFETRKE
jgi:hypothetical protein